MKIKMFYTNGEEIAVKGRRAKEILRRELKGTGFNMGDIAALKRGEWISKDGTTLDCHPWQPERGYSKALDCYDESSGMRWDRFAVLVK